MTVSSSDQRVAQVLAERAAWDYAKQHQLDLVVINPVSLCITAGSAVLAPDLSGRWHIVLLMVLTFAPPRHSCWAQQYQQQQLQQLCKHLR
jgi:hypothetical protein